MNLNMKKTPKRKLLDNIESKEVVRELKNTRNFYYQGQNVYCKDNKEVWVPGTVQCVEGEKLTVLLSSKKVVRCKCDDLLLRSEINVGEIETLTSLTPLNEATVLCCLNSRYNNGIFYTSTGSTVIALNPFTTVNHLYTDHMISSYHSHITKDLGPHIYHVAERSYRNLVRELGLINQSIIVSGESGSGKTVSAKHLLRYLTKVSNQDTSKQKNTGDIIQNKLLDSNPLLEAFGNAATPRNSNSSRFGKFIKLQFNRCGSIRGGAIQTYLLEKTRTVHQADGEFNFHIFYQMLNQTTDAPTWLSSLQNEMRDTAFNILPLHKSGLDEHNKLSETLDAMKYIGLCNYQQSAVFELLSSILYLGNIDFSPLIDDSASTSINLDSTRLSERSYIDITVSLSAMEKVSVQLGLSSEELEKVFLHRNIQSSKRKSIFVKPVSIVEAKTRRDCLAMLLYSRLFEWLVSFVNSAIECPEYYSTIGLLDIYGFEIFENNSLEQLCINYANEKIQQYYVIHFLKELQEDYDNERIEWRNISYNNNEQCLNAIEGKHSIFGVLNEEVYLNRKSNKKTLADRLLEIPVTGKDETPVIKKPKKSSSEPAFVIQHYAGDVKYNVDELITKNKDNIPVELVRLIKSSDNWFIQELFSNYATSDSPGKKKKTVLSKFKSCLDDLMMMLSKSDVHYIRCIKPNVHNKAKQFDRSYVVNQLKASGVIQTVEICKQGYPARIPYWEFLQRYGMVIPEAQTARVSSSSTDSSGSSETDISFIDPLEALLKRQLELPDAPKRTPTPKKILRRRTGLSPGDHARKCCAAVLKIVFGTKQMSSFTKQFGKSKLFLQQSQLEKLEASRAQVFTKHVIVLQWAFRRFLIKTRWHRKFAVRKIWKHWLRYRKRRRDKINNIAAGMIQRAYRNWSLENNLKKLVKEKRESMLFVQTDIHERNNNQTDLNPVSIVTNDSQYSPWKLNYNAKIPGSTNLTGHQYNISPDKGQSKRIMERSFSGDEMENNEPPLKKLKVACKSYQNLKHLQIANGILTKRHLPKTDLRFHTRPSVLKNAHIVPMKEIQCSITDCLKKQKDKIDYSTPKRSAKR